MKASPVEERMNHVPLNPFTTGNPFLGTKLLGFSIGRGSGALKGLNIVINAGSNPSY